MMMFQIQTCNAVCELLGLGSDCTVATVDFPLFFHVLRLSFPKVHVTPPMAKVTFDELNTARKKHLYGKDLLQIPRFQVIEPSSPPCFPTVAGFLEGQTWTAVVDGFMLVECALLVTAISEDSVHGSAHANRIFFALFNIFEISAKMVALSPRVFFLHRKGWIHIEFALCVGGILVFLVFYIWDRDVYEALDVAAMIFVIRVTQGFYRFEQFQVLLYAVASVARYLIELFTVLIAAVWTLAVVGMLLFGGEIYQEHSGFGGQGAALESAGSIYLAINYNSMSTGMNALIMVMVGNNWDVFVTTAAYVTDLATSKTYYFFVMALLSFVFLNVVVACFVESYSNSMETRKLKLGRICPQVLKMIEVGYAVTQQEIYFEPSKNRSDDSFASMLETAESQVAAMDPRLKAYDEIALTRDGTVMALFFKAASNWIDARRRCVLGWHTHARSAALLKAGLRVSGLKMLGSIVVRMTSSVVRQSLGAWRQSLLNGIKAVSYTHLTLPTKRIV
eukprot:TRINITY_DN44705_c0_g1_i1.p1 TRINITY_DN44705_c0_g1~~TRINITY_DN44705_c0_g1_i1.p1  ORF type:complete len:505 (+),score=123.83 TRINITY_DN44705_c0_g1_i1:1-1515(+)